MKLASQPTSFRSEAANVQEVERMQGSQLNLTSAGPKCDWAHSSYLKINSALSVRTEAIGTRYLN